MWHGAIDTWHTTIKYFSLMFCFVVVSCIAVPTPRPMWSNSRPCFSTTTNRQPDLNASRLGKMSASSASEARSSRRCFALAPKGHAVFHDVFLKSRPPCQFWDERPNLWHQLFLGMTENFCETHTRSGQSKARGFFVGARSTPSCYIRRSDAWRSCIGWYPSCTKSTTNFC